MNRSVPDAQRIQFAYCRLDHVKRRAYSTWHMATLASLSMDFGFIESERKDEVPLFSPITPADFNNLQRGNAYVGTVNAMVLDFDQGQPLDEIMQALKPLGYWGHTTHSHTDEKPKFRVILPLSAPVPASEWREFWESFIEDTGLQVDKACKDPARVFYLPSYATGKSWGDYFDFGEYGSSIDSEWYLMLARQRRNRPRAVPTGILQRLNSGESRVDWEKFDPILFLDSHGIEWKQGADKLWCYCPWRSSHSHPDEDTIKDAYFHRFNGKIGFHCSHSHCQDKWIGSIMHEFDGEKFC